MGKLPKLTATWLLILGLFIAATPASAEDDITGHWHEEDMRYLVEKGILQGNGSGYHPNNPITRGQFAALMARALNLQPATQGAYFTDLDEKSGVLNEVLAAANAGIVTGYGDGTFKPYQQISRQHMAVMADRALNYLKISGEADQVTFKDQSSIFPDYLYAIGQTVQFGIFKGSPREDGIYFRPLDLSTRGEASAVIARLVRIAEQPEPQPEPEIKYSTATVDSNGNTKIIKRFDTFDQATAAMGNGQVVLLGDVIVNMHYGIVVTKPTASSSLTNIYEKADMKSAFTYVTSDTELEFLEATADYVKVKVAGTTGFIKHANADLKTWDMLKGRSYYTVNASGDLVHHIYSNRTGSEASYVMGKAPASLKQGQKYLSWDQIHYMNWSGQPVQTFYNYFQFLPARTQTVYTAAEIDAYIIKMLKGLEAAYPNNAAYKDASKRSKLIGIGEVLKKVEREKNVNALMILALAQHESNYGLSTRALEFNNLFGLRVYDDNPANDHFETVEENINELMDQFFNRNYIPPNAPYANGPVFGTKAIGFNMRYASDPYWGAKAAGHMYRADKAMGGRDFGRYTIGLTLATGLNARTSPVVGNNIAFSYEKAPIPVAVLGSEKKPDRTWYRVASDDRSLEMIYLAGEHVRIVYSPN
ncbi:S-layer homology domain-containing protein [Bhargavaea ginsengi]|uniref:S-layer homology domain-containing protein n=1 Tax=Bhargavaea ginsengi TaxID=426757 RepID=UPI00203C0147|nr:S-layer homology domain-containing protein [Bhargavaea ginsengi]MCM3089346.1 S-layer homology domain-containing protein [Bhargavaea ginsengi]